MKYKYFYLILFLIGCREAVTVDTFKVTKFLEENTHGWIAPDVILVSEDDQLYFQEITPIRTEPDPYHILIYQYNKEIGIIIPNELVNLRWFQSGKLTKIKCVPISKLHHSSLTTEAIVSALKEGFDPHEIINLNDYTNDQGD